MIELTDKQHDALKEICNVGVSRAARQLSSLTMQDIDITIPEIVVSSVSEVITIFSLSLDITYSSISLDMRGGLQGITVLLFSNEDCDRLANLLTERLSTDESMKQDPQDVLVEVGNIIVSSSVGAMGNMLGEEVILEVPKFAQKDIKSTLEPPGEKGIKFYAVLAISTALHVQGENITSKLLLIFEVDEVPKLLERLDKL